VVPGVSRTSAFGRDGQAREQFDALECHLDPRIDEEPVLNRARGFFELEVELGEVMLVSARGKMDRLPVEPLVAVP
jgi:hypothetical protein